MFFHFHHGDTPPSDLEEKDQISTPGNLAYVPRHLSFHCYCHSVEAKPFFLPRVIFIFTVEMVIYDDTKFIVLDIFRLFMQFSQKVTIFGNNPFISFLIHTTHPTQQRSHTSASPRSLYTSTSRTFDRWRKMDGNLAHLKKLGGGNSNMFYVHPENWGRLSPILTMICFKGVGEKPPTRKNGCPRLSPKTGGVGATCQWRRRTLPWRGPYRFKVTFWLLTTIVKAATLGILAKGEMEWNVLPRNLTWNLKMMVSKRNHLFQGLLFRFHVKFQGCMGFFETRSFHGQKINWAQTFCFTGRFLAFSRIRMRSENVEQKRGWDDICMRGGMCIFHHIYIYIYIYIWHNI